MRKVERLWQITAATTAAVVLGGCAVEQTDFTVNDTNYPDTVTVTDRNNDVIATIGCSLTEQGTITYAPGSDETTPSKSVSPEQVRAAGLYNFCASSGMIAPASYPKVLELAEGFGWLMPPKK